MASNGTASTSPLVVSSVAPPSPSAASTDPSSRPSSASPPISSVDTSSGPPPTPTATPSQRPSSPSSPAEPSSPVTSPTPSPPSSTPVTLPSSPPPASSPPPSSPSSTPEPPSSTPATTQTTTAPTRTPTTQVVTSIITPSPTVPGGTVTPITVTRTRTTNGDPTDAATSTLSPSPGNTDPASLQSPGASKAQGGLSPSGKTAIAVVVPVVVVALLVVGGILLWRRRKAKKSDAEARRKEVEEYGYNPNNDPTLPAVGMATEMAEDQSGYRGWGNTTASSHAKGSTTLTSGNTYSDSNSNPGGYQSPGSPTHGNFSDGHSVDPLVNGRRETLDSDGIGALGAAPVANNQQGGVHRGPSNASSSYSAADRSDNSGDYPIPVNPSQDYYDTNANNGYYHASSPYDNNQYNAYNPQQQQQPVIRDVSARRNTRIENPSVFPQQGNSGIAQNF